jgi:DNA-binding transcriptional LysR family regulator
MDQVQAMRIFVRVADKASFRGAARDFHVSNALVTRAIVLLEGRLKTRLMNRTTRAVSLTEAGARYLEGCRTVLEEIDHLEAAVTHTTAEPSGTLRVAGLADSTALSERHVGAHTLVPVATSALIAERGLPSTPTDLQRLPLIALLAERSDQTLHFRHDSGTTDQVMLQPVYSVNNGPMVRLATRRSMGFSILPRVIVQDDLDEGALVRLLPDYWVDGRDMQVSTVYPARHNLPRKTRAFVDYASDHLRREFAAATEHPDVEGSLTMQNLASVLRTSNTSAQALLGRPS